MADFAGALNIGTLVGTVELDDKLSIQVQPAIASIDSMNSHFTKTNTAAGEAERALKKVGTTALEMGNALRNAGAALSIGITAPLTALSVLSTKASQDFEAAMTKVVTLSTNTEAEMENLRKGVLALSTNVGIGPQALADALLVVTSAGYKGQEALDILTASAKASAVGLGATQDVARAVTSVIAAYGAENISAAHATDVLYKAVVEGKAEATEFAGALGPIVGIAAKLGVSFEELSGFVATYSRLGVSADEASTALRGTLTSLLGETQEGRKALQTYGLTVEDVIKKIGKQGLGATLIELSNTFHGNAEAMNAVFGNVRALAGVLGVTGNQADSLTKILAHLKNGTNELDEAFTRTSKNSSFTWNQLTAQVQVLAIQFGDALAPSLKKVMDNMQPMLEVAAGLVKWFSELPAPVQQTAIAFGAVAAALGPIALAAGTTISAISKVGTAVKLLVGAEALGSIASTATAAASGITSMGAAAVTSAAGVTLLTGAVAGLGVGLVALIAIRAKEAFDAWSEAAESARKNAGAFQQTMDQASKIVGHQVTNLEEAQKDMYAYAAGLRGVTLASVGVKEITGDLATAWTKGMEAAGHLTNEVGKQIVVHLNNAKAIQTTTGAIKDQGNALVSQAQIYKQAQAQIASLTGAEREELTAGKMMGRQASDIVAAFNARFGAQRQARGETLLTVEAEHLFEEALSKTGKAAEKNKSALDALAQGKYAEKFQAGIASIEGMGRAISLGLVPALHASVAEANAADQAFADLLEESARVQAMHQGAIALAGMGTPIGGSAMNAQQSVELLLQRDKQMNDQLRQNALTTTSFQVMKAIEAGNAQRNQLGLTEDAYNALDDMVVMQIGQIIRENGDWEGSLKDVTKQLKALGIAIPEDKIKAWEQAMDHARDSAPKVSHGLKDIAGFLDITAQGFTQLAQVSQGTFGVISQNVGRAVVGFSDMFKVIDHLKDVFAKQGRSFKEAGAAMAGALASGLLEGINGIMSASQIKNKAGAALMGGLSGAAAGAIAGYVAAGAAGGPWGALAGFIVGAVVAVWKGSETRNIMHQVGRQWGSDISSGLAETIKKTAKETFAGSKDAAQIFLLADTISEKGITTSKAYQTAIQKLRDTFSMLETGVFSTGQAQKVLNDNFATFTNLALKNGVGLITAQMKEIIELDRRFGTGSQAVADLVSQQLSRAAGGFNKIAASFGATWAKTVDGISKSFKDLERDQDKFHAQVKAQIPASAAEFNRLGRLSMVAFNSMVASGMNVVDALSQLSDGLGVLSSAAKDGFQAQGGLAELLGLKDFVDKNQEVVSAASGLNDMLQGLANSAFLDQTTFTDLGDEAVSTFAKMVAGGASGDQALRIMQPTLQTIWELQKDFGFAVDEGTQALLNQAETAGVVGEKQRSIQEKMLIALEGINTAITGIATAMGVTLPQAAEAGASAAGAAFDGLGNKIGDAIGKIPSRVSIPIEFPMPNIPDPTHGGTSGTPTGPANAPTGRPGEVPEPGEPGYTPPHHAAGGYIDQMQHFASGGWMNKLIGAWTRGSDDTLAMLNKKEYVVRAGAVESVGKPMMDYINMTGKLPVEPTVERPESNVKQSHSDVFIIPVKVSGDVQRDEAAIWAALPDDVKKNKRGIRTKLRQALGIVQ